MVFFPPSFSGKKNCPPRASPEAEGRPGCCSPAPGEKVKDLPSQWEGRDRDWDDRSGEFIIDVGIIDVGDDRSDRCWEKFWNLNILKTS